MKFLLFSMIILATLQQNKNVSNTTSQNTGINGNNVEIPVADSPVLDLKVPYLNEVFTNSQSSGLKVGKSVQLYTDQSGDYKIMAYRPSEDTMKIRITRKDEETGEDKKFYENSYLWNDQF